MKVFLDYVQPKFKTQKLPHKMIVIKMSNLGLKEVAKVTSKTPKTGGDFGPPPLKFSKP